MKVSIPVDDYGTARILIERADVAGPNGRLFPYTSRTLRKQLEAIGLGKYRISDFRLLYANRVARAEIKHTPAPKTEGGYKAAINRLGQAVAEKLGITANLAIKSYIDPELFGSGRKGGQKRTTRQ